MLKVLSFAFVTCLLPFAAHAKPQHAISHRQVFDTGASVVRDDRYPQTVDVRGWREAGQRRGDIGARPRAWCGWWMALRKGLSDRRLWLAREWAHVGQPASGPAPGVIGVMRHHVYEVVQVVAPGRVLAISGNDGHRVRTRVRSTRGTIAWRHV
jgi:hypothetical protein